MVGSRCQEEGRISLVVLAFLDLAEDTCWAMLEFLHAGTEGSCYVAEAYLSLEEWVDFSTAKCHQGFEAERIRLDVKVAEDFEAETL